MTLHRWRKLDHAQASGPLVGFRGRRRTAGAGQRRSWPRCRSKTASSDRSSRICCSRRSSSKRRRGCGWPDTAILSRARCSKAIAFALAVSGPRPLARRRPQGLALRGLPAGLETADHATRGSPAREFRNVTFCRDISNITLNNSCAMWPIELMLSGPLSVTGTYWYPL